MSKDDPIFNDLLKHNLITKVYDPQANKNSFALTPKGADWYRTLASLFAVPKKSRFSAISFDKVAAKVNKNAPDKVIKNTSKATINKYMNRVLILWKALPSSVRVLTSRRVANRNLQVFSRVNLVANQ